MLFKAKRPPSVGDVSRFSIFVSAGRYIPPRVLEDLEIDESAPEIVPGCVRPRGSDERRCRGSAG